MRKIPFDIGTLHFCGIGGIGMSGIAEVMHNLGIKYVKSDQDPVSSLAGNRRRE